MPPDQLAFSFSSAPSAESDRGNVVVGSSNNGGLRSGSRSTCISNTGNEAPPHLRDEIARLWGLPLRERIEVTFIPAFALPAARGLLELRADPAYPWDPHQPLVLRVAGCDFTTRDIERWTLLLN